MKGVDVVEVLNDQERQAAMLELNDWSACKGRDAIEKTFKFASFRAAFAWMTNVAMKAEKIDHHPEWCNVYNRVEVVLTTHSAKGVTSLDIDMAKHMNNTAGQT